MLFLKSKLKRGKKMNYFKEKCLTGDPIIGVYITLNDPCTIELFDQADFVMIDTEHAARDRYNVKLSLIAAKAAGVASFVRVPNHDKDLVKYVLEQGPTGIIFPDVFTPEQVQECMETCLYPPKGIRGYGPQRANNYGRIPREQYFAGVEDSFMRIIQLEDVRCLNCLDEMLSNPYLDMCMIGPQDLALSAGCPGNPKDPKVVEICGKFAEACNRHNIPIVVSGGQTKESYDIFRELGFHIFLGGSDATFMTGGIKNAINAMKASFGVK